PEPFRSIIFEAARMESRRRSAGKRSPRGRLRCMRGCGFPQEHADLHLFHPNRKDPNAASTSVVSAVVQRLEQSDMRAG
ncbi:hypothetical protein, partial [Mesorhizobium sp. M1378]|uniref:hypothetical protein n=1 Tax=Mesorhizobium sp. M1378 TaxID=2957092 RepID=UPI0033385D30